MKALRPEIEILKKKTNGDQQQMGVEQMKLFREAGVNPLGGCIPALLQIPIFFALFSFLTRMWHFEVSRSCGHMTFPYMT